MKRITGIFFALFLLAQNLYADEGIKKDNSQGWEIAESFKYESGKYGTGALTRTYALATTLKRYFERGDLSLTIPFISQTSDSQTTRVGGFFTQRISKTKSARVTNSGFGDMYLDGSYYLLSENEKGPLDVDLDGYLKFPTADKDKNLGTGKFDAGPGISLGKRFSSDWRVFFDLYYIFIGSPSGLNLKNQTSFDLGVCLDLSNEAAVSMSYGQSSALVSGNSGPKDLLFGLTYKLDRDIRLFGNIAFGLSNASPDQSITLGAALAF